MRKFFVFVLLCCFASSARAEFDCSKRPTCEGMGYVIESFAKCYNQVTLRCPFDATYV